MSYSKQYKSILQDREPFQLTISEKITKRNNNFYEQEKKLFESKRERNYPTSNHTLNRKVYKLTKSFIDKICKKI